MTDTIDDILKRHGEEIDGTDSGASNKSRLSVSISELLARPIKKPRPILSPWLSAGTLAMIHAWRGVGKTHVALGVAMAAATGSNFLRWCAPERAKVLYVDGEMPAHEMSERIRAGLASSNHLEHADDFRIITPDLLADGVAVPNLATPEGQAAIEADLDGRDVVLFDNLATLFPTADDPNSSRSFMTAQDYLLRLRRRGLAVVLLDHDNKTGGNRGTSAKADVLDVVIQLKTPKDYLPSQGARFEVSFTKARGLWGRDVAPFEAHLTAGPDGQIWTMRDAEEAQLDRYSELVAEGLPDKAIREEMGIGGSGIAKLKKQFANRVSK